MSSTGEDPLTIYKVLRQITHGFTITPVPHQTYFENIIPRHLQVASTGTDIGIQSAMLYVSLHPLFTTSPADIFRAFIGSNITRIAQDRGRICKHRSRYILPAE